MAAILQAYLDNVGSEGSPCAQRFHPLANLRTISNSVSTANMTDTKSLAYRCFISWRPAKPRPAGQWPNCWAFIGTRLDAGWRSMPLVGWRPSWTAIDQLANSLPYRHMSSPAWSRPSNILTALRRTKPSATGCSRHIGSTSSTKRSTPWCALASALSSKCRGLATQKNPDALREFQATCQERLQRVIPAANTRAVRVFSQDESRFGLLTVRRRRMSAMYGCRLTVQS